MWWGEWGCELKRQVARWPGPQRPWRARVGRYDVSALDRYAGGDGYGIANDPPLHVHDVLLLAQAKEWGQQNQSLSKRKDCD